MIHFIDAFIACTTVRNPRKLVLIAEFAIFTSEVIVVIKELLVLVLNIGGCHKGRYFIFDSDGLNITPKAHKDIEVRQEGHVEGLSIIENGLKYLLC